MPELKSKLYSKALKLLSYRPRSIFEIKNRLQKLTDSSSTIDLVIKKLLSHNLLNDQEFATWWIDQRSRFKPKGNLALTSELRQKGIDQQVIKNSLLSQAQELKLAKKLLTKRSIKNKNQAFRLLYSRGFSSSLISTVIDELTFKE